MAKAKIEFKLPTLTLALADYVRKSSELTTEYVDALNELNEMFSERIREMGCDEDSTALPN